MNTKHILVLLVLESCVSPIGDRSAPGFAGTQALFSDQDFGAIVCKRNGKFDRTSQTIGKPSYAEHQEKPEALPETGLEARLSAVKLERFQSIYSGKGDQWVPADVTQNFARIDLSSIPNGHIARVTSAKMTYVDPSSGKTISKLMFGENYSSSVGLSNELPGRHHEFGLITITLDLEVPTRFETSTWSVTSADDHRDQTKVTFESENRVYVRSKHLILDKTSVVARDVNGKALLRYFAQSKTSVEAWQKACQDGFGALSPRPIFDGGGELLLNFSGQVSTVEIHRPTAWARGTISVKVERDKQTFSESKVKEPEPDVDCNSINGCYRVVGRRDAALTKLANIERTCFLRRKEGNLLVAKLLDKDGVTIHKVVGRPGAKPSFCSQCCFFAIEGSKETLHVIFSKGQPSDLTFGDGAIVNSGLMLAPE